MLSVVSVLWASFNTTHLGTQQQLFEMPEIRNWFSSAQSLCLVCSVCYGFKLGDGRRWWLHRGHVNPQPPVPRVLPACLHYAFPFLELIRLTLFSCPRSGWVTMNVLNED